MSKERFAITDFGGIISRADAEDIPDNAAVDSDNIDGDAAEGKLMAIPASATTSNTYATASRLFEWIKRQDNTWNLVNVTAANIQVVKDFYGTKAEGITPVACIATSMVSHNEEVHVANVTSTSNPTPVAPNWTGYCDYKQFGAGSILGWKSLSAVISIPVQTTDYTIGFTKHAGTTPFDATKIYHYNVSFIYDGFQESPMGSGYQSYSIAIAGEDYDYVTVTITLKTVASLNSRVTGVKLYRREADSSTGLPTTLWRLQQAFDATTAVAYVDRASANQSWADSGGDKTITYADNNTDVLSSYEEQSGMPETLKSSDVYYTLNTDLNAFHFVAGCEKTGLPDASMIMFRSKQYRYDMFDWTNDLLRLPTVPTALKAFNGKIWAFDENHIYRINPDGMYIEDITEGIGCLSQRSIVITDYGMFWNDYKNSYWHDGEKIIPIGDAVRTAVTSTYDWSGFSKNYTSGSQFLTPIVVFHALKNYVLFITPDYAASNGKSKVWAFHVGRRRWDKWGATAGFTVCGVSTTGFGAFSGKNGEVYVSDGTNLVEPLGGGATKRAFYWTSKIFDFGQPFRLKKFYELNSEKTALTAAPALTYDKDRAGSLASFTAIVQGKLFQFKITEATAYNNIVYSVEILFRRLAEL